MAQTAIATAAKAMISRFFLCMRGYGITDV